MTEDQAIYVSVLDFETFLPLVMVNNVIINDELLNKNGHAIADVISWCTKCISPILLDYTSEVDNNTGHGRPFLLRSDGKWDYFASEPSMYCFYFKDPNDALRFKLVWG